MKTVFDPSLYGKESAPKVEEPKVEEPIRESKVISEAEPVDVPDVKGIVFDPKLYELVLSQPEGMNHKEYRKVLGRYVSTLGEFERFQILARREEIEAAEEEWRELNHSVLRRLGFNETEAAMLMDKRLDSPGMRFLIRRRAEEVKKGAKAEAVLRRVR